MIDYREDTRWTVYIHTSPSGKRYVGITSREKPEKRWGYQGKNYHDSKYFWNAIQKYGWDNFEHEIIAQHLTKEEANAFEVSLIKELQTQNRNLGYNIAAGGDGVSGIHLTPDQVERAVESKRKPVSQFDTDMNFIAEYKSLTEAAEKTNTSLTNISEAALGKTVTACGYIWIYSDQIDKTDKQDLIDKYNQKKKPMPVCQFSLDMTYLNEYPSIHVAGETCGIASNNIYLCAIGKANMANQYIWILKEDYIKMLNKEIPMRKPYINPFYKSICQFSKSMEFIKEYSCIAEASRVTKTNDSGISECALGKQLSANDYIWIYKSDYQRMLNNEIPMRKPIPPKKKILQYNLDGTFIREYQNIEELVKLTGFDRTRIYRACKGYSKTSYGYIWKYKERD